MPSRDEVLRYVKFAVKTIKRVEDLDGEAEELVLGLHSCTEDDKAYFYEMRDLDTVGVDSIWD